MIFKSIFESLDLFGVPITIRYQGSENHKTFVGSFVSILILFAFSYYAYETIQSLLNYENYTVVYQENIVESPQAFDIKPSQFTFALGLQGNDFKAFHDEQIYKVEAVFADTKRVYNNSTNQYEFVTDYIELKTIPCTEQHFQINGTIDYFLKLPFKDLYCLPLDSKISLEGQFGANIFRWLRFRIKKCLDPSTCKQFTEVEEILKDSYLQVYYVNYAVEITDKENPFKPIAQTNFWQPSSTQRNIYAFFKNSLVSSDEGLLQSEIKEHKALLFSFDRDQVVNINSDVMFEFQVMLEKNKESMYIRKYQKLSNTLSQLGGLFNFLIAIGTAICYPFSKLIFHQKLLNEIFRFQSKKNSGEIQLQSPTNNLGDMSFNNQLSQKESNANQQANQIVTNNLQFDLNLSQEIVQNSHNQMQQSQVSKKSTFQQKFTSQLDEINTSKKISTFRKKAQSQNMKDSVDLQKSKIDENSSNNLKIDKKLRQKKNTQQKYILSLFQVSLNDITIKIKDIFISFFSQRKSHYKMIKYGMDKLDYQLDIQAIITRLLEIEKLKQLVLNEDQIKLFEFIPQPVIYEEMFETQQNQEFEKSFEQNSQLKTGIFYEDHRTLMEKAQDAQNAFNSIFKNQNSQITNIDKKLLSLLDPRVSSRFDQNIFGKDKETNNLNLSQKIQQSQIQNEKFENQSQYDSSQQVTDRGIFYVQKSNTDRSKDEEPIGIQVFRQYG